MIVDLIHIYVSFIIENKVHDIFQERCCGQQRAAKGQSWLETGEFEPRLSIPNAMTLSVFCHYRSKPARGRESNPALPRDRQTLTFFWTNLFGQLFVRSSRLVNSNLEEKVSTEHMFPARKTKDRTRFWLCVKRRKLANWIYRPVQVRLW